MSDGVELNLNVEVNGTTTIVIPTGDIDLSCAASLRSRLGEIQAQMPERLVVDLTNVPYMDSSGVATLVEGMQVARRNNSKLVLCNLQERVRSIFEIARLDMVFTIVNDIEEALSAG